MRRWWWAGIVVLAVCGTVLLGGYWWTANRPDCGGVSSSGNTAGPVVTDPAAVEDYWTPERMASARPAEMPVDEPRSC